MIWRLFMLAAVSAFVLLSSICAAVTVLGATAPVNVTVSQEVINVTIDDGIQVVTITVPEVDIVQVVSPGEQGIPGITGADGAPGAGVPAGGTDGQVLLKSGADDYVTIWSDPAAGVSSWNDLTDKPSTFPPADHEQPISSITGLQTDLDGKEATGTAAAGITTHAATGHLTVDQEAAIDGATSPTAINPLATMYDLQNQTTVGLSSSLYLCDDASVAPGWHELEPEATLQAIGEHAATLTVLNTVYELDRYASDPLHLTRFPAGEWKFNIYARMNITSGTTVLQAQPVIVHTDGSYTVPSGWGAIRSSDINLTTYAVAVFPQTILPAVDPILVTDRFGVIISAVRTNGGGTTSIMYMSHDMATGRLSHVVPPLTIPIHADAVVFTPVGNITASNAQAAIQQAATNADWSAVSGLAEILNKPAFTRGYDGREVEFQNSGTYIQWRYITDPPSTWTNLTSIASITGGNGKTVLSGSGAPSNSLGTDGDFYIDLPTAHFYGPKASGVWPAYIDLIGPQGPPGPSASVTQSAVIGALDDSTDGAVLLVQQGPTEAGTAAKFAVANSGGSTTVWIDSNGTVVRQCLTGDTAPAVKLLSPTGTLIYSVSCDNNMVFKGKVTIQ